MNRTELLAIAKPILFNTETVRAILDGRKTVTRRAVKPQPWLSEPTRNDFSDNYICQHTNFFDTGGNNWACCECGQGIRMDGKSIFHARYKVGDILYVRETWSKDINSDYVYRTNYGTTEDDSFPPSMFKWHPSIHMPKSAARIFLRVTDVRVERLQDITEEQAEREGIDLVADMYDGYGDGIEIFRDLWNSTIKKSKIDTQGWNANPWVFVYEFEKLEENNESL